MKLHIGKMSKFIFIALFVIHSYNVFAQPELWSMTLGGGVHNAGTVFKTDINGSNYSVEYSFGVLTYQAKFPQYTTLLEATYGLLYGVSSQGGTNDYGILFKYDPINDSLTKLLDFDGANKGQNPRGRLIQASNEMLYGMTDIGGANNLGNLFHFDPSTDVLRKT